MKDILAKLKTEKKHDIILIMVHPWRPWMPPLGLAYVSSYIRSQGFKPLTFDFNAKLHNSIEQQEQQLWDISTISRLSFNEIIKNLIDNFNTTINELVQILIERPEKLIGFSVNYLSLHVAAEIAQRIKKKRKDKLIVVGGPGCFWDYDRKLITPGIIDIFVIGEGEKPIIEIIKRLKDNKSFKDIAGIVYWNEKYYEEGPPPIPIMELDEIPYPTFEEFDLADYGEEDKPLTLPLLTSRGCIGKCSFCIDWLMTKPFRVRSAEGVVKEIEEHIKRYGVRHFSLNDLLCNGSLKNLEKICDLIIEKNLNIEWGSYAMARPGMSLELLQKMKRAGCSSICYGIESGSDAVLKKMHKIYTAQQAEEVLRLTQQAGIKATYNLIIGHPGEGRKEFKETLNFMIRNKKYTNAIINISTCFINPTSELGCSPEKFNLFFPRSKTSFRFLKLKKLLPNYYRIFGISQPVSRLQGVDISNYVDDKGNSKKERIKRLIKTIKLAQKLNLFQEEPIINVYPVKNKKLEKILYEVEKRWTIMRKKISLSCDGKGKAQLLYQNCPISFFSGIITAFKLNNSWYDSSQGIWKIEKINDKRLTINIKFSNIAVELFWYLKIHFNFINWTVNFNAPQNIKAEEVKIGILLQPFYNFWKTDGFGAQFPNWQEKWQIIRFDNRKFGEIILIPEKKNFPLVIYRKETPDWFFQLEIPHYNLKCRLVHCVKGISNINILTFKAKLFLEKMPDQILKHINE